MLKTFAKGGIHPAENKFSNNVPLELFPIPELATISMAQSLGKPADVVVEVGNIVKVGTLLGKASGVISANVHSSVSGTVKKIDSVLDASGFAKTAVIIEVNGDEWESSIDRSLSLNADITDSKDTILQKIKDAGIVGLGGATFPLHVKLTTPSQAECLIINAAECEPYLTSDHALMLAKAHEICVGIQAISKVLGVAKAYIGIEKNKQNAISKLQEVAKQYAGISIVSLQTKYPQGGEKQLIQAITGKEVASGQLPISVGVVVTNVATAFAVYEAVQKNKPLIDRVVTVTGKGIKTPKNFMVRIGTSVKSMFELVGGLPEDTSKVLSGGPMMGKALVDIDVPVVKGMSGLVTISNAESNRISYTACIRCGKCITVCPMGLPSYMYMNLSVNQNWEEINANNVLDCIECGSCSYICPASRPILDAIRLSKQQIRLKQIQNK